MLLFRLGRKFNLFLEGMASFEVETAPGYFSGRRALDRWAFLFVSSFLSDFILLYKSNSLSPVLPTGFNLSVTMNDWFTTRHYLLDPW